MSSVRSSASSVVLYDKWLWITGGLDQYMFLKTTELITLKPHTSKKGPDLPTNMNGHCMINLDQNHVMVTAGCHGLLISNKCSATKDTFIVNVQNYTNQQWKKGEELIAMQSPSLLEARGDHGCASLNSSLVIVAGGWNDGGAYLNSVEIFSAKDWTQGTYVTTHKPNLVIQLCPKKRDNP